MMRSLIVFLTMPVLMTVSLYCQDLEDLWEAMVDDPSLGLYFESLEEDPIDLNTATPERLQETLFLDPLMVDGIIDYRNRYYPIHSLDEITAVPGISPELVEALRPYVIVKPQYDPNRIHCLATVRCYRQYPHSRGFSERMYPGDPWGASSIIFCSRGNLSVGGVVQKDAGELRWNDHPTEESPCGGILSAGFRPRISHIQWISDGVQHR
jgi:hypothetical protein